MEPVSNDLSTCDHQMLFNLGSAKQSEHHCNAAMFKVLDVMYVNELVFWSCPECMCKVTSNFKTDELGEKRFFCKRCQEHHDKSCVHAKYKLSMKVCDCSNRRVVQLTVFGSSIERIIGCSPLDYQRYRSEKGKELTERQIKDSLMRILVGKTIIVQVTDKNWAKTDRPAFKGQNLILTEYSNGDSLVDLLTHANGTQQRRVTEPNGDLARPVGGNKQTVEQMGEQYHTKPIEESWQESLIEEFNQSLALEVNERPSTLSCKTMGKRLRSEFSLSNTPSAPVKAKPRINLPEDVSAREMFASPLLLPNDFHTPVKQNLGNSKCEIPCSSRHEPSLITSTPRHSLSQRATLSQAVSVNLSVDLFSETEDTL